MSLYTGNKINIQTATKEGSAEYESSWFRIWRKRWIVLDGTTLYTFEKKRCYENPIEIIDLRNCFSIESSENLSSDEYFFTIKSPLGSYKYRLKYCKHRNNWTSIITKTIVNIALQSQFSILPKQYITKAFQTYEQIHGSNNYSLKQVKDLVYKEIESEYKESKSNISKKQKSLKLSIEYKKTTRRVEIEEMKLSIHGAKTRIKELKSKILIEEKETDLIISQLEKALERSKQDTKASIKQMQESTKQKITTTENEINRLQKSINTELNELENIRKVEKKTNEKYERLLKIAGIERERSKQIADIEFPKPKANINEIPINPISKKVTFDFPIVCEETETKREEHWLGENHCAICFDNKPDRIIVPCGHMGVCSECTQDIMKLGTCPFCRTKIKQIIKCFPSFGN